MGGGDAGSEGFERGGMKGVDRLLTLHSCGASNHREGDGDLDYERTLGLRTSLTLQSTTTLL